MKKTKNRKNSAPIWAKSAEEELYFLRAVIQQVSDALVVTNKRFQVIFVNKAMENLYGYKKSEILGKDPGFLDVEPLAKKIEKDIRATISKGKAWRGTILTRKKDGESLLADLKISALRDRKNKIDSYITMVRDVTPRKRQEEELYASREMLQLVLDNIPQRIFWKDRHSVYGGCNKTFAIDAGLKDPKDIVGKDDYSLPWTREEAEFYRTYDRRVMENDRPELAIYESQRTAEGTNAWLKTNKVPLHDAQGRVVGMLGTYEDITEKKRAEEILQESEEKYRTLVENAADAIFQADVETGYIINANKRAADLLGLPLEKIIGMHQTEIHPKGEAKYYQDLFSLHIQEGHDFKSTAFIQNASGRKIPVQISGGLYERNGRKIITGIFRDITDLKLVEEALRKDKDGLEKAVGRTKDILENTQRELEDAKRLSEIGALAATVAHELRNPLGVIKTALYNIRQKTKEKDLDKHLTNMEKKIAESEKFIQELLHYSQIKVPRYKKVHVLDMLNESIGQCRLKYTENGMDVRVRCKRMIQNAVIDADPMHINELFMNILDNAYQAYPNNHGGSLEIGVHYDRPRGKCTWTFHDNGVGIDPKDLPHIFDPFFTTRTKGTGLGLSICNQLVNLYGGRINVDSQKGGGTKVTLSLPICRKN